MNDKTSKKEQEVLEENYWQDVHQKVLDPAINKDEFKEGEFDSFSVVKNRRDFLKIMGFSFTMLPIAACTKGTVRKAIPFLEKSDMVTPGVASWYATTYDGVPLLLKTREGRPIKVEGNDRSIWALGGATAVSQASILSLYDSYRIKTPTNDGNAITWNSFMQDFKSTILKAKAEKKKVVIVTDELRSPSTVALIEDFSKQFGNIEHIVYSTSPESIMSRSFDEIVDVDYDISKAGYVLGFGADFLGADRNSVHNSKQYAQRRDVETKQSPFKHVQIESLLSLTGSNADERYSLDFDEMKSFLLLLLSKISGESINVQFSREIEMITNKVYKELLSHKEDALVINGLSDIHIQKIVNRINYFLGNAGNTINLYKNNHYRSATPEKFEELVNSLAKKKTDVDAIILVDVNPYYNYYDQSRLEEAFGRVPTKFCFAFAEDETSSKCQYVAPLSHAYESWNDTVISSSEISVNQPVINQLYDSRQFQDVLLNAIGKPEDFHLYMKEVWKKNFWNDKTLFLTFESFWMKSVQDGVFKYSNGISLYKPKNSSTTQDVELLLKSMKKGEHLNLVLYEKGAMRDGRHANNPWLQELPDPITKVTWDNYVLISPAIAKKQNIVTGDMVEIKLSEKLLVIPALVQPGLAERTIGVALGYGRTVCGKVGLNLGKNAYPLMSYQNNTYERYLENPILRKIGKTYDLAMTQTHHSIEGRDLYRETTLKDFTRNPKSGNEKKNHLVTMWSEQKSKDHQWAMAIDLNKCNGCSACVVSCNAENNVPVVGREEVLNRREMHWMRIDRYYKGSDENPTVAHQPMTCHHCENAPCESVCPVLATVHSSDGLNQQVYNRCVGTRYCANNCPYKVRRFNWFDYPHTDPNERMVLNPDVTVRSRGVMEKCSLCIQRIQEAKLVAKKEGRELKDGEIKLACQQSCSSDAIVFGDLMDPNSKISQMVKDPRNFTVLEELNIKPRLSYLTKIRNKD